MQMDPNYANRELDEILYGGPLRLVA